MDNLSEISKNNTVEIINLLDKGLSNRHVSALKKNGQSSRSHVILTIKLFQGNELIKSIFI